MNNCKILLIDHRADLILINESIEHLSLPVNIESMNSLENAMTVIKTNVPDIILIGSGKLMEDFGILVKAKDIPIVILCESDGFDVLLKNGLYNVLFVTRPFDTNDIPEIFKKALEFWTSHRKRGHNV